MFFWKRGSNSFYSSGMEYSWWMFSWPKQWSTLLSHVMWPGSSPAYALMHRRHPAGSAPHPPKKNPIVWRTGALAFIGLEFRVADTRAVVPVRPYRTRSPPQATARCDDDGAARPAPAVRTKGSSTQPRGSRRMDHPRVHAYTCIRNARRVRTLLDSPGPNTSGFAISGITRDTRRPKCPSFCLRMVYNLEPRE